MKPENVNPNKCIQHPVNSQRDDVGYQYNGNPFVLPAHLLFFGILRAFTCHVVVGKFTSFFWCVALSKNYYYYVFQEYA